MKENFQVFLGFVWPGDGGFDSPKQGYHVTPGDSGGGTYGGVIEATWQHYVALGLVTGSLRNASLESLEAVLRASCWGDMCDALPAGLDVMVANGKMMTGEYQSIVEQCLGWTEPDDVDNHIGPHDMSRIAGSDTLTLMWAIHGNHHRYLTTLGSWNEFGNGWTSRLNAVMKAATALVPRPVVITTSQPTGS